ncbi:MAG: NUDIX domain-containing protein, partial [Pseudomonadota bacterium]
MSDQFFRASAGAVIMNSKGLVLACRRSDVAGEAWQLPQGGIKVGEDPLDAVYREIAEETAIPREQLELVGVAPQWLTYELPEAYRSKKTGRGQTQKWHLFYFSGQTAEIKPDPK